MYRVEKRFSPDPARRTQIIRKSQAAPFIYRVAMISQNAFPISRAHFSHDDIVCHKTVFNAALRAIHKAHRRGHLRRRIDRASDVPFGDLRRPVKSSPNERSGRTDRARRDSLALVVKAVFGKYRFPEIRVPRALTYIPGTPCHPPAISGTREGHHPAGWLYLGDFNRMPFLPAGTMRAGGSFQPRPAKVMKIRW